MAKYILGCLLIITGAALAVDAPKDKPADPVVELQIKGLPFSANRGKIVDPLLIRDEKGLEAAWPMDKYKGLQEKVKSQVDFQKQQLAYFAWSGSGGDKLTYRVEGEKKPKVIFQYEAGETDDLKSHFRMFAIPRDATVELKK